MSVKKTLKEREALIVKVLEDAYKESDAITKQMDEDRKPTIQAMKRRLGIW